MGKRRNNGKPQYNEVYLGMHTVLAAAPLDSVKRVFVDDKVVWSGLANSDATLEIDAPSVLGGKDWGGGVRGRVDLLFGQNPTANQYLAKQLGQAGTGRYTISFAQALEQAAQELFSTSASNVPEFRSDGRRNAGYTNMVARANAIYAGSIVFDNSAVPSFKGVVSAVFNKVMIGNSPYPSAWSFEVTRQSHPWQPHLSAVGDGMNPAHILYELLTSPQAGQLPVELLDLDSFSKAAQTYKSEGLGLSLTWAGEESVSVIVDKVLNQCNSVLVQAKGSGALGLRPLRAGQPSVMSLTTNNVLQVKAVSWGTKVVAPNTVAASYYDLTTGKQTTFSVGQPAPGEAIREHKLNLHYITDPKIARQLATSQLTQLRQPALQVQLTLATTPEALKLQVADVVTLTWPPLGVPTTRARVTAIGFDDLSQGISATLVEDIFGNGVELQLADSVLGGVSSAWTPIDSTIPKPLAVLAQPAPYFRDNSVQTGHEGIMLAIAKPPGYPAVSRGEFTGGLSEPVSVTPQSFTHLVETVSKQAEPSLIKLNTGPIVAERDFPVGTLIQVGQELMQVQEVVQSSLSNNWLLCRRGVLDTLPASHELGEAVWDLDENHSEIAAEYPEPGKQKQLGAVLSSLTGLGPATSVLFTSDVRAARPYPPGNIRVEAEPGGVAGLLVIKFSARNRLSHVTLGFDEPGDSWEPGVQVRVQIGSWHAIINPVAPETVVSLACPGTIQQHQIAITSVRDGLTSWQAWTAEVSTTGGHSSQPSNYTLL